MKKQLLIMVICVSGLGDISASRIKIFSEQKEDNHQNGDHHKNLVPLYENPAKKERLNKKRVMKSQLLLKKHVETQQAPHDIPALVLHRNQLMSEIDETKSDIHNQLKDAKKINKEANLVARKEYRSDKKSVNVELNKLRLEARIAGSQQRSEDAKNLHTQIENLQGFGVTPEAQVKYDDIVSLRDQLSTLKKDQRDTISALREKCAKAHVKYQPAMRVKKCKEKVVKEKKVKEVIVKKPKIKKPKIKKPKIKKPKIKKSKVKMAKVKKEKVIKEKVVKPAKIKKEKLPKKEQQKKAPKVKKELNEKSYSPKSMHQEENGQTPMKRKRMSSAKEEDGSMSSKRSLKRATVVQKESVKMKKEKVAKTSKIAS